MEEFLLFRVPTFVPELVVEMDVWTAGSALVQWDFFSVTVEGCELNHDVCVDRHFSDSHNILL